MRCRGILLVVLFVSAGAKPAQTRGGNHITDSDGAILKVLAVIPGKNASGYLEFRIKMTLSNLTGKPMLLETMEKDSVRPDFVAYEKHLTWSPHWLLLGPIVDYPPRDVLELKPGRTIRFEELIGSVAAYRMRPEDGIPFRGEIRARVPYFVTREEFDRFRSLQNARVRWAISGSFRVDWPPECLPACMPRFEIKKESHTYP